MPPITLNRRRFLGCSAAASLALSQGNLAEAAAVDGETSPVRLGVIGVGNRGTALLRALLELPGTPIVAVCDFEPKHRQRGQGIVEKARGQRPDAYDDPRRVLDRPDIDAVIVAIPCDAHEPVYHDAIMAGKHLYAEKPLALTLAGCDRLIAAAGKAPELTVHVGFQRRSNPRFREGVRADPPRRARTADRSTCQLDQQQRADEWPRRLAGPPRSLGRLDGRTGRARLGHFAMVHRPSAGTRQRLGSARAICDDGSLARRDRPLCRGAGMGRRVSCLVRPELGRTGRRRLYRVGSARHGRGRGLRLFAPERSPSATVRAAPGHPARPPGRHPDGTRGISRIRALGCIDASADLAGRGSCGDGDRSARPQGRRRAAALSRSTRSARKSGRRKSNVHHSRRHTRQPNRSCRS